MSKKDKILELLTQKRLTVKEIANITDYSENEVRVYINRLKKEGKIKLDGKTEDRFKIYKAVDIQDLKTYNENMNNRLLHDKIDKLENEKKELKEYIIFLNDFFKDNIDFLMKNETISNFVLNSEEFDKIEELSK